MDFKNLMAYQKAFSLAMAIFEISKSFPKEEIYSLTDQIRRSSRSVCANFAEAYRKRLYPKNFTSKLSDSDAENSETLVCLDFCLGCGYISEEEHNNFELQVAEIGKLLNYIIKNPNKFGVETEN